MANDYKMTDMNKIKLLQMISIALFIPAAGSVILWLDGRLDIKIMAVINWLVFLAEVTIFVFAMKMMKMNQANVIIPKGFCQEKAIKAETNVFPNFLVPTNVHRNSIFRISLQIKEYNRYPLFYVIRTCEKDTCIQELNRDIKSDIKSDIESVHIFDIKVDSKEKLNFKFNEDVVVKQLLIEELYIV